MTANTSQTTHPTTALIVIDMEQGFLDPSWGVPHDLEGCRRNVAALIADFTGRGLPIVLVRHDSIHPHSPLRVGQSGNDFFPEVAAAVPDLLVTKTVNSSFLGTPDLAEWLREHSIDAIVLAGIQTNMCVETTARMGGNLGFAVTVALDATTTFPLSATSTTPNSPSLSAEQLIETTAVNLSGGGFAEVTTTESLLSRQPRSA
jgi:nicotinamidase-related amidase